MKKIDYNGTLTSDIQLVNEHKNLQDKLKKKRKILGASFWIAYVIIALIFINAHMFYIVPSLYILTSSFLERFKERISIEKDSLKTKKKLAKRRIEDLVEELRKKNKDSKNLSFDVRYENIKDAVIVTQPTELEKIVYEEEEELEEEETINLREPDYEIEGSFDEYLDVVVSYIYYLDSNNKINAFKETKKSKHFDDKPNIFNQKVIAARKATSIRDVKLETVDDKELAGYIPVRAVLQLKQD